MIFSRHPLTQSDAGEPLHSLLRFICGVALVLALPSLSWAHGFAGKRFFPSTLATEDPFVSDELSILIGHFREPAEGETPATRATDISLEYSKRITDNLGVSVGEEYSLLNPESGSASQGFGNLELGLKYQFLKNEAHELIASVGLAAEIGGTGSRQIGAESFTVLSPMLFFGKGFGDLPEALKYLRPVAITGVIGPNFPTRTKTVNRFVNPDTGEHETEIERNPTTLTWGFALQYNLQYLQSFVKDIGLGNPFKRMVLLVEFPMETCLNQGCSGTTTGTINPGVVWFGKSIQLGIEARIPVNRESGSSVGVLGLIHFFIDDLFPKSLGKPLF